MFPGSFNVVLARERQAAEPALRLTASDDASENGEDGGAQ